MRELPKSKELPIDYRGDPTQQIPFSESGPGNADDIRGMMLLRRLEQLAKQETLAPR